MEKCNRCGEMGEDRRTLIMECFYDMNELKIPFKEEIFFDAKPEDLKKIKDPGSIKIPNGPTINITPGIVTCSGELTPIGFFTLRVCKRCRAEWMEAIKIWFENKPNVAENESDRPEANIPIRINGTVRWVTEKEWEKARSDV